jgi:hypothetical protein
MHPYEPSDGVALIREERERQVTDERYDVIHDDEHANGELAMAALVYLNPTAEFIQRYWPFEPASLKISEDGLRDYVKAGALIAAEIDQVLRLREAALTDDQRSLRRACAVMNSLLQVVPLPSTTAERLRRESALAFLRDHDMPFYKES